MVQALTDGSFDSTVLQGNDKVWVVLFTSQRSEDARNFGATWDQLAAGLSRMSVGVVDIDTDEGRAAAVRLGQLEGGIPAVHMYHDADAAKGAPIMAGGTTPLLGLKKLRRALKAAVQGLRMSPGGKFLKRGVAGLDPKEVLAKKARKKPAKPAGAPSASSSEKKAVSSKAPATEYYLIADVHPGARARRCCWLRTPRRACPAARSASHHPPPPPRTPLPACTPPH